MVVPRPKKPRRRGRPSKRESLGSKEEIRAKLIDAALALVAAEGIEAVTTTRLMQALGMTQSGFYQYFANVDECLTISAEHFADELRERLKVFRRRVFADVTAALSEDELRERFKRSFDYSVDESLSEPRLAELLLFFRHRHDRSALGTALKRVFDQSREEMVQESVDFVRKTRGADAVDLPRIRVYVAIQAVLWVGAVEILLEDPALDHKILRDVMARTAFAVHQASEAESNAAPKKKRKARA